MASMLRSFRFVPAFALLSAAAVHANSVAASDVAKLVPEGTVIYLEIPSLERLDAAIHKVMSAFAPAQAEGFDVDMILGELDVPGSAEEIDHKKPFAFCLVLPAQPGAQPMPTMLVPAVSAENYAKSVAESGVAMQATVAGSYVVVSSAPITPAATPPAIALGLPAGEVACRIDMKRLVAHFRPLIDMGLAQAGPLMAAGAAQSAPGMDMAPMMDTYVSGLRSFLDSGETLDLALRLEGDRFEFATNFTALEKSALAEFGSKEKTDLRDLARLIDASAPVSVVIGMDQAAMLKHFTPFLDAAINMYPEASRASMKKAMDNWDELAAQTGPGFCVNADFTPTGMQQVVYMRPRDATKLLEAYKSMMTAMPGCTLDELKTSDVGGVQVTRSRLHVDPQAFELTGQPAATSAMVERMYGKDGLALAYATKGGVTALVLGGDDAFLASSLGRISTATQAPASLTRSLEQVAGLNPTFVVHYDFGKLAKSFAGFMPIGAPGMPSEMPDFAAKLVICGGIDGRTWKMATSTDLAELGVAFRKMTEAAASSAK
ncbi:MAG: hypothetical protein ACKVWV_10810 [Planctomycetota bacterium]